jgi:outer membrane murein-binding lipoprotein Lpp
VSLEAQQIVPRFTRTAILSAAVAAALLGCSGGDSRQHEVEGLRAHNDALEAEVREYRATTERLEGEVKSLNSENGRLESEVASLRLELEAAKNQRPVEFVERVVERPASPPQSGKPGGPDEAHSGLEILSASARATERNNSWWRFGWVVTIKNHSKYTQAFALHVQFMDSDGYVVDEATRSNLSLPAGGTQTFRESELISASVAPRVASVNPVIKP